MANTVPSTVSIAKETPATPIRLPALDWMRGLVMVLMAVDHAGIFDAGHLMTDSWLLYDVGSPLPVGHFITRWITHLCAPVFLFLAGTALALSLEKRRTTGIPESDLDRHLLKRGLILLAFDMFWIDPLTQQVLFAIGMSLICMILLRRLSNRILAGMAIAIVFSGEALVAVAFQFMRLDMAELKEVVQSLMTLSNPDLSVMQALHAKDQAVGWFAVFIPFLHPGIVVWIGPAPIFILYPFLPWLAMMMSGWVFGRYLLKQPEGSGSFFRSVERVLLAGGIGSLAIFAIVRGLNGYGNMFLPREDGSLVQWLHVSKYPPSIVFIALESGLMALCLWGFFCFQRMMAGPPRPWNPLLVFGQTALFFYLLHMPFLGIAAVTLDAVHKHGLGITYLAALGVLVLMYPLCCWFRHYKSTHSKSWVRYI